MNILIVEDEKEIADLEEIYLEKEGYTIYKYNSSKKVLEELENLKIDLAILDVMTPEIDGFTLCNKIRRKYNFPILFVTAKIEEIDKIHGLTLGADDYITKPFEPLELVARVKAHLRRYKEYNGQEKNDENKIDFRNIVINNKTHECFVNETLVDLTPLEFSIFWTLCKNRGNVVKTEDLFQEVWQEKYYEQDNNTVMVHIRHLREKLQDNSRKPKYIKTIWGVGYKIEK